MADWVTGKVTKIKFWTDALFSLTVHAPIHPFTAGQFAKLGLDIDGERVQRAYSYVNARPIIRISSSIWLPSRTANLTRPAALKPGDDVQIVSDAAGFFVLDEIPDCETLWMLATGTAIGPYLSILQYGKDRSGLKHRAGACRALRRRLKLSAADAGAGAAVCRKAENPDRGEPGNGSRFADRPRAALIESGASKKPLACRCVPKPAT